MMGFDALNDAERRVLGLLGAGHTAKSIAVELDLTVNAVNERLREARRKTGAASSRELARSWAAQENGDEQIGLGAPSPPANPPVGTRSVRTRMPNGVTVAMIVAAIVLASAATRLFPPQAAVPPGTPSARYHAQLLAEPIDMRWAPNAEVALQSLYAPLAGMGEVNVRCGATLCEVAAELTEPALAQEALAAKPLLARVRHAGFSDQFSFETRSHGEEIRFVAFWRRAPGRG